MGHGFKSHRAYQFLNQKNAEACSKVGERDSKSCWVSSILTLRAKFNQKLLDIFLKQYNITRMANRNTKQAHRAGFASKKDQNNNGTKLFKGSCCDTSWDNPNSKKTRRKQYQRKAD